MDRAYPLIHDPANRGGQRSKVLVAVAFNDSPNVGGTLSIILLAAANTIHGLSILRSGLINSYSSVNILVVIEDSKTQSTILDISF